MGRKIKPFNLELEMIDAASDGKAVAKHEGQAVFVEGAVPGDTGLVHIYRKKRKLLQGRMLEIITPSPDRVEPRCKHFGVCGGCKWQHLSYEAQLRFKESQVVNALVRVGKVEIGEVLPILGLEEEPFFYRNKLEFSFCNKAWLTREEIATEKVLNQDVLGYHAPGFFDKVLNIDECLLQLPLINDIRNAVRDFAREQEYSFFDNKANEGLMRTLTFRTSVSTGEIMIILILGQDKPEVVDAVFGHLESLFPQITQYIWIHNPKMNSVYNDLDYHVWKGGSYYTEQLEAYQFRVRPVSFFQTNPKQAKVLYGVVKEFLAETLPEGQAQHPIVYDLYSGTGSIGISVSELAEKIVGIEYVESAVEDARENVRINGLEESRFSFYSGDMKVVLSEELVAKEGRPDVLIADPSRQGMENKVVSQILQVAPQHIIYVSCKPATQARDLEKLQRDYEILKIQPVDMFPHTAHVENVALLRRREAK